MHVVDRVADHQGLGRRHLQRLTGKEQRLRVRLTPRAGISADHHIDPSGKTQSLEQRRGKAMLFVGDHCDSQSRLVQGTERFRGAGVRLCTVFIRFLQLAIVVKEALDHLGPGRSADDPALRGRGALDQNRRAAPDHAAYVVLGHGLEIILDHRPVERQRDIGHGIEQCAVQIEQHRRNAPPAPLRAGKARHRE